MNIVVINQPVHNRGDESDHRCLVNQLSNSFPDSHITILFDIGNQESIENLRVKKPNLEYVVAYNEKRIPAEYNIVEKRLLSKLPNLPFSHIYVASQMHDKIPQNSTVHLGILSPLRSWSYFDFDPSIELYCNQGGFGIDGNMSTMVGASLVNPGRLFFAIVGDLSFFYDMNVVGNRHVSKNIRILLINNALGAEFHLFKQLNSTYVKNISRYLSAGGHFGNKSPQLIKHYAEDLGYEYLTASNKEEFLRVYQRFLTPQMTESPMLFEVFTQVEDENEALKRMWEIESDKSLKGTLKKTIKDFLGKENIEKMKDVLERKV